MNTVHLESMLEQELPAASRGDQQAYGRIVTACQNTVTAIALAITRDVQASEDIAQEAFLKAWQNLNRLNNGSSFLPWLRQITRNLARDWLRANRNRPLTGEGAEIAIGMAADPAPTPSENLLRVEEEVVAADIISALPEDSREVLLLYYREGQSSQQVADLLGLSDAAVRKRLSRARGTVREELMKRFSDFARSTAPGAAFAVAVSSALMITAPAASAAAIIGAGTVGSGAGKLGLGGLGVSSASGGVAAGALGAVVDSGIGIDTVLVATLSGGVGALAGGLYLLSYATSREERTSIMGFVQLNTVTAALFGIGVLLLTIFTTGWVPLVLFSLGGMLAFNYQCVVILQRIMAPMLARDATRHGRRGPTLLYSSMYGRLGIMIANIAVLTALALSLSASGRF